MDTIKKELVDQDRAGQIFPRLKTRLSNELIKTNERYIDLLIDELNQYFVDLSSSTINTNDLPDNKSGPISGKHNKVLVNVTTDIDKIHNKRVQVQDVITKAVNFLSTERISLNNAVSKMYSRVVNQKLRSSMNDRHLTVFTEYFTDSSFVDNTLSTAIEVDPALSALTLSVLTKNDDNSDLIDQSSIYMHVDLVDASDKINGCIYPICNEPISKGIVSTAGGEYFAGFGRTISTDAVDGNKEILFGAGPKLTSQERTDWRNIQSQCLTIGASTVTSADDTVCEFEFVLNDFKSGNIKSSIIDSIKNNKLNAADYNVDPANVIIDDYSNNITSFNGSHYENPKGVSTTKEDLVKKLKTIGLKFNLNSNAKLKGKLSQIRLSFAPGYTNLKSNIAIDFSKSYILDTSLIPNYSFQGMITPTDSLNNKITEDRLLILDNPVANPTSIFLAFQPSSFIADDITNYIGVCWLVQVNTGDAAAHFNYGGSIDGAYNHSTNKFLYVYHDIQRNKQGVDMKVLNEPVLKSIIDNRPLGN